LSAGLLRLLLPAAVAVAGCAPVGEAAPAPGAIADLTEKMDRRAAGEKALAVRDADARAATRADRAVDRIAESGRARRQADKETRPLPHPGVSR
jgi:hypothetical protein